MKLPRRSLVIALLGLGLLLGAGGLAWYLRAPDPHTREVRRVRQRLLDLAGSLSFSEADGRFTRLAYPERLAGFFADPVDLEITLGTRSRSGEMSRAQIRDGTAATRASNRGLDIRFLDIVVDLPRDPSDPAKPANQATAHLTSTIFFKGDPDYWIQEFRLQLVQTNASWLVRRIETVETMKK